MKRENTGCENNPVSQQNVKKSRDKNLNDDRSPCRPDKGDFNAQNDEFLISKPNQIIILNRSNWK